MSILITLIIFSIIVVIHEWGHMRVAKACGVYVEEFAVGMGPKLIGIEKGGTLYTIRLFPLGGFCRMTDETTEEKTGFNDVSVWKRMAICVAGPLMNFVLALVVMIVLSMMSSLGTTVVSELKDGMPAKEAGIEAGDKITAINGRHVHISSDLNYEISEHYDETLEITLNRNGQTVKVDLTPKYSETDGRYLIGISMEAKAPLIDVGLYKEIPENMPRATLAESIYDGYWNAVFLVRVTFEGFAKLISRSVSVRELSGPIGVTTVVGETYESTRKVSLAATLITMADIMALLSANLGIMNLLPIPALDGGRLLIYIVEVIRKKKIPPEKEGMINLAGFALLMALAAVVAFNDILKIIH